MHLKDFLLQNKGTKQNKVVFHLSPSCQTDSLLILVTVSYEIYFKRLLKEVQVHKITLPSVGEPLTMLVHLF